MIGTTEEKVVDYNMLEKHGIYKRFWHTTFGNIEKRGIPEDCQRQFTEAKAYAANLGRHIQNGDGLILSGHVGTMKTTLAVAILRQLVEEKGQGYFIPMVSLLDNLNNSSGKNKDGGAVLLIDRIRTTPLLILDDLGAEYDHTWVQAKVDAIITERYNRMRSTIITSNLDRDDIRDRYQQRIYDRLRATNQLITFHGSSLRTTQKGQRYA
jgi:DNA replication protein DnaC